MAGGSWDSLATIDRSPTRQAALALLSFLRARLNRFRCHRLSRRDRVGGSPRGRALERLESRALLAGDLVAHWRADDLRPAVTDGQVVTAWLDAIKQVPLQVSGTPQWKVSPESGRAAMAFEPADGVDSFILSSSRNPLGSANDFSVGVYFQTDSRAMVGGVENWFRNTGLVDAYQIGFGQDWGLAMNGSGQVAAGVSGGGATATTAYSDVSGLNDGRGHLAVLARSGSQLRLYVDGRLAAERTDADARPRTVSGVSIGSLLTQANPYTGLINEVRFYNGALSVEEAAALHTQLTGYYNNQPPRAVDDSYTTFEDSTIFAVRVADGVLANDVNEAGERMTAEMVTPARHGTVDLQADGSFTYRAEKDFSGQDEFTYRANDFRPGTTATVRLTVAPTYDAPRTKADLYLGAPGQPLRVDAAAGVLANDASPDGLPLRAQVDRPVGQGRLTLNADGSFEYDPLGFRGRTSFSYRVLDGTTTSEPVEVQLVINSAPQAVADRYRVDEDKRLTVFEISKGVLANDFDAEKDPLTAVFVDPPAVGKLVPTSSGFMVYEPPANYHGEVTFTYRADDGFAQSALTTVVIEVVSVNDPTFTQPDGYLTRPGVPLEVSAARGVLANDTDLDDQSLVAEVHAGPQQGVLALAADGSFTYRAAEGFSGLDTFQYVVRESASVSAPVTVQIGVSDRPVVINEIMARNTSTVWTRTRATEANTFSGARISPDWIELRNLMPFAIDAGGMSLSDDPVQPTRWQFPAGTMIPANGYLVVLASGLNLTNPALDEGGRLHTNFSLDSSGESVLLVSPQGQLIHDLGGAYPPQSMGITYGLDASGAFRYLLTPTPAAENVSEALVARVNTPVIEKPHGFYAEAIQVSIQNADPLATVRYTLNGAEPTLANSEVYAGPITVGKTTVVRARSFREGYLPSLSDTRTYVFLDDVLKQAPDGKAPAGWPSTWGANRVDYGMDPDIVNSPTWGPQLKQAFTQIPSMSIVTDLPNLFDARTGIYARASAQGFAAERPASLELINPDGTTGFQQNIGLRIRGGFSRSADNPKHAFRVYFDSAYGEGWLNFPLFGDEGSSRFAKIDLRTTQNYSWAFQGDTRNTFLRDIYSRDLQGALGQPYSRGRHYHLYINGMYWGLFQTDERIDNNYAASYLGGEPEDYDVVHNDPRNNGATDGTLDSYKRLWAEFVKPGGLGNANMADYYRVQGMNPDGTRNSAYERLMDVDNIIDYMIITYFTSDSDGPGSKFTRPGLNNYFGTYNRSNPDGWKFYEHDSEHSMDTGDQNMVTPLVANGKAFATFNPHWMHEQLATNNSDYLTRFRDRVAQLFSDDGLLSDAKIREMLDRRAAEINMAIIAESARWGDGHVSRATNPFTKTTWETAVNNLKKWSSQGIGRRQVVLNQFTGVKWWFPNTHAPTFSRQGGVVEPGVEVAIVRNGSGEIYVTTDGSDPRLSGGEINPKAIRLESGQGLPIRSASLVRARTLNGVEWSPVTEADFRVETPASLASLRISEINYNPGPLTEAERLAGVDDADRFEFVELKNVGNQTIDLAGVRFERVLRDGSPRGIEFEFTGSGQRLLAPGQQLVMVRDLTAFSIRYKNQVSVAGQWLGALDDSGEPLTLVYRDGSKLQLLYSDRWYRETDGRGATLEAVEPPVEASLLSTSLGWRASAQPNGTPGGMVRVLGDSNGDGRFDESDLLAVFMAGKYEDGVPGNAMFADGDWNGDGDFDSADFVYVLTQGTYSAGAPAAKPVVIEADPYLKQSASALDLFSLDPMDTASATDAKRRAGDDASLEERSAAGGRGDSEHGPHAALDRIFLEWASD